MAEAQRHGRLYPSLSKRGLQVAVTFGALVPILAGGAGAIAGPAMLANRCMSLMSIDSHFRYLSGLLLAIGLGYWSTVPHIEKKTTLFQTLTAIVFIGGLGRLYGVIVGGLPDHFMMLALVMELAVTPSLAFWQKSVARKAAENP